MATYVTFQEVNSRANLTRKTGQKNNAISTASEFIRYTYQQHITRAKIVPTTLTLNGVIALILRFSPNSIALQADYITVVEDRPIMSVKYCLAVPVVHFWPKLTHPAARSLFDS